MDFLSATRADAAWRPGETLFEQVWRAPAAIVTALLARFGRRGGPHIPPLSAEWLRVHAIESSKHRNDL